MPGYRLTSPSPDGDAHLWRPAAGRPSTLSLPDHDLPGSLSIAPDRGGQLAPTDEPDGR